MLFLPVERNACSPEYRALSCKTILFTFVDLLGKFLFFFLTLAVFLAAK